MMSERIGQIFHNIKILALSNTKSLKCHTRLTYTLTCHNVFQFFVDYERRTGIAAIVLKSDQPYKHVVDFVPSYAQPRFVRIVVGQSVASYLCLSSV